MGNRSLRKQVAQKMKAAGIPGKLYRGRKRGAFDCLPADILRDLIHILSFSVGETVNDCDGFNHRISHYVYRFAYTPYSDISWKTNNHRRPTMVFVCRGVNFDNGSMNCGCSDSPAIAMSRDEIENMFRSYLNQEEINQLKEDGWENQHEQWMLDTLNRGEHICDENGFPIFPNFEKDNS